MSGLFGSSTTPLAVPDRIRLAYTLASDISALAITAATWTDLITNQSFTVERLSSLIEISVSASALVGNAATVDQIATRLVLDSAGTAVNRLLGGERVAATAYGNPFSGAGPWAISGLAPGSHTIKVQVYCAFTASAYIRAATNVHQEFCTITVVERR